MGDQPTPILTQRPLVSFETQRVWPPTEIYIGPAEPLLVQLWNSVSSLSVRLNARLLRADGLIVPVEFLFRPTADRTTQSFAVNLAEGFLLGISMNAPGSSRRGQCFGRVQVFRGSATQSDAVLHTLFAGWVVTGSSLTWPDARTDPPGHGGGVIRSITGTDPAAGAEVSETVPTGAVWRLLSVRTLLVTDATAATRRPHLVLDDGTNVYFRVPSQSTQAASLTYGYTWSPTGAEHAQAGGQTGQTIADRLILPEGHRVRTITDNLQAGDNYAAPQLLVEEWILI